MSDALTRYIAFWEQLTPASAEQLSTVFADNARFCDPHNDVRGHAEIARIFDHLFKACHAPQFRVQDSAASGERAYLHWEFTFTSKGGRARNWRITGMSRVVFNDEGLVLEHVDHWDPARQIYEQIPVLGAVMRSLRRHLAA